MLDLMVISADPALTAFRANLDDGEVCVLHSEDIQGMRI